MLALGEEASVFFRDVTPSTSVGLPPDGPSEQHKLDPTVIYLKKHKIKVKELKVEAGRVGSETLV